MSIQIEVPLDALKRPTVARALSDLMLLLGGQTADAPAPLEPPARPVRRRPRPATAPAAPIKAEDDLDVEAKWRQFVATRPERTRRFLTLLEQHGSLTVDQAVDFLNLPGPKAMGGLTGALRRWAPRKGVQLPFKAVLNNEGQRCWVWEGIKG